MWWGISFLHSEILGEELGTKQVRSMEEYITHHIVPIYDLTPDTKQKYVQHFGTQTMDRYRLRQFYS
jgi:hypothetical protein